MYKKTKNTTLGAKLLRFLIREFPGKVDLENSVINDEVIAIHLDPSIIKEASHAMRAFLIAWEEGHKIGYFEGVETATKQYQQNLLEVIEQTSTEAYERGYRNGAEDEWGASIIPSDAFDIEVFAVQPSNDFETGKQAFIGFKYLDQDEPQFEYTQVQFAAPNLTIKPKINACQLSTDYQTKSYNGKAESHTN
jgi:hypothetical protein